MKKVLIGHSGQFGDLFIGLPMVKHIKEKEPDADIYIPIANKYIDILPAFMNQKDFTPFILNGYDDFPTRGDRVGFSTMGFDQVYNPMTFGFLPESWYQFYHQTEKVYLDYNTEFLGEFDKQIKLYRWFDICKSNHITFQPFAGFYDENNPKKLSVDTAQRIVDRLSNKGYKIVQIGGPDEPKLRNTLKYDVNIFESLRIILEGRVHLGTDSWATWAASAYSHPCVGLYAESPQIAECFLKNIQPVNENARYINSKSMENLLIYDIESLVDELFPKESHD